MTKYSAFSRIEYAVADGKRKRPARTAFPTNNGNSWHTQAGHFANIAGDGFGLAAFLGAQAWKGTGQVDQTDYGTTELLSNLHATQGLAIALRMRHSEIAANALLGGPAFAVANDEDFLVAETGHAARHGNIVAIGPIPVNLAEIRKYPLDKVHRIRPLGMARCLNSSPRR